MFTVKIRQPGSHQYDEQWITDISATQEKNAFFEAYPQYTRDQDLRLIHCNISLEEIERQVTSNLQDVTGPDAIGPYNARAAIAYHAFLTDVTAWKQQA